MYKIEVNSKSSFNLVRQNDELFVNEQLTIVDLLKINKTNFHILHLHKSYAIEVISFNSIEKNAQIRVNNNIYNVSAKDQFDILLERLGLSSLNSSRISEVKAPMPGLVLKVLVEEGTVVKKGDSLFVLEAMKMENIIKSVGDVVVKSIRIKPGDKVEKNQVLMMF